MKTEDLIGQWLFVESKNNKYIGVVANAGTKSSNRLYFAGISEEGGSKAISIEFLADYNWKEIVL